MGSISLRLVNHTGLERDLGGCQNLPKGGVLSDSAWALRISATVGRSQLPESDERAASKRRPRIAINMVPCIRKGSGKAVPASFGLILTPLSHRPFLISLPRPPWNRRFRSLCGSRYAPDIHAYPTPGLRWLSPKPQAGTRGR